MQKQKYFPAAKKSAFTLIEILIVMALMIMLAAAGFTSLMSSQRTITYINTDEKILSLFRNARTYAVTGRAVQDFSDYDGDSNTQEMVTPANYGINFTTTASVTKVSLFADMRDRTNPLNEGKFTAPDPPGFSYVDEKDLLQLTYDVDPSIKVKWSCVVTNTDPKTVFFSPIYADVKFDPTVASDCSPNNLFYFGICQATTNAKKCYGIHPIAGNPEPVSCPSGMFPTTGC